MEVKEKLKEEFSDFKRYFFYTVVVVGVLGIIPFLLGIASRDAVAVSVGIAMVIPAIIFTRKELKEIFVYFLAPARKE